MTTGSETGIVLEADSETHGTLIELYHNTESIGQWDKPGQIVFKTRDAHADHHVITAARWQVSCTNATDGSEDFSYYWYLMEAGSDNEVMRISSSGALEVDADSGLGAATVGKFDDYDDAIMLRDGISKGQRQVLRDIGILTPSVTGGDMINVIKLSLLCAGGIYQNRARIDTLSHRMEEVGVGRHTSTNPELPI